MQILSFPLGSKASVLWMILFIRAASLPSSNLEGIPEGVKKGVSSHFSLSFPCSHFSPSLLLPSPLLACFPSQAIFSAKIEKWIAALLWTELYPYPYPDSYVEALTACVTIFGDKAFKGVINIKLWSFHMPARSRSKSFKLGFSSI